MFWELAMFCTTVNLRESFLFAQSINAFLLPTDAEHKTYATGSNTQL